MYPLLNGFSFAVSVNIFPVLPLREFPRQMSEFHCESAGLLSSIRLNSANFPVFSRKNREVRNGDRFADDCLHRQLVYRFRVEVCLSGIGAQYR